MDPAIIAGGSFGQLWRYKTPAYTSGSGDEQFYAKPLVYTPASYGSQIVLVFSEQNRLFALDAVNGTLIAFRDMNEEGEGPFTVAEFDGDCNDISDSIGITGTPIIDDSTETVYFWAKSYAAGTTSGLYNGVYRFHAVDAVALTERSGFPVLLDGHQADNDATRYFQGGIQLQRTALNLLNGVVYAGFGGHCDLYNYTGWLVGMSAADGHFVTAYATSAGVGAPAVPDRSGSGVWMSGTILSSDQSSRFFFATGNGYVCDSNDRGNRFPFRMHLVFLRASGTSKKVAVPLDPVSFFHFVSPLLGFPFLGAIADFYLEDFHHQRRHTSKWKSDSCYLERGRSQHGNRIRRDNFSDRLL